MTTCPACGEKFEGKVPPECPRCHVRIEGATESFKPVAVAEDPPLAVASGVVTTDTPTLVVRKGAETGERFAIDRDRLTIGRDPGCDIFLNDVTVSRSHAVLTSSPAGVSLEDAGSLNGTYVNDVRVDKAGLVSGDIVQIGMFQMVFVTGPGSVDA